MSLKAEFQEEQLVARIAELEAALAREQRMTAGLREVGVALGRTLDLDELLELILLKITELLEADRATLYLLDEANGELVSRIAVGDAIRSIRVKVGEGIAGTVARTGKPLRVRNAYRDRRFSRDWDEVLGYRTRSILAAPLKSHVGKTIGVVQVLNKKKHAEFTTNDEALLAALATEAAVSIDNSRLLLSIMQKNKQLLETKDKLEESVRHLKLLFELESTMGRASSLPELAHGLLKEAASACDSRGGAVLLFDDDEQTVEHFAWDREKPADLKHELSRARQSEDAWGVLGQAMHDNEPVRTFRREPRPPSAGTRAGSPDGGTLPPAREWAMTGALAVPLEAAPGTAMGALALYDKSDERPFDDDDTELLRLIAANFCTAVLLFRSRVRREREERLSTIGSLLSSVVHDLKSPMAVISGCMQMMTQAEDLEKRKEYAALVVKQFELIAAMQREVLEFARGERRLLVRRVYLGKFFEELAEQLRRDVEGTRVKFSLELGYRGTARFDQGKLTRVIHNLARNALEAMGTKGGMLTLKVSRSAPTENDKGALVIEVGDTGPGIPKQIESRLFQSFVTAGKKGGTGLGLAIVKKIVEEHGGEVTAQSTSQGTTFTIVLPQRDPAA